MRFCFKFDTLQIQYRFLCSHAPELVTTFSVSLARSYRRGASPETVSFPVAAIQLLMRFIYETGKGPMVLFVPRLCVPNTKPGAAPKAPVSSQGEI